MTANEYQRQYRLKNAKKIAASKNRHYCNNKAKIKLYNKNYYLKNSEKIKAQVSSYNQNHKEEKRAYWNNYEKRRKKVDVNYRLTRALRHRVYLALVARNASKKVKSCILLGCSLPKFKAYIESKFTKGMSWDNYGKWHIDHIIPCKSFDLKRKSEQLKCFNYSNCQPLWATDNLRKGTRHGKQNE